MLDTYLAKEIALREAFEVKVAILVLAYVYFIYPIRWA